MTPFRLNVMMIVATNVLFVLMLLVNEWLFTRFEFASGINWVYLPAGMRLLCTLLFGGAGAIGLLTVSWAVCFFHFFSDDYLRSFMGGILAAAAPYLVYCVAQKVYGLRASLTNLTPKRLLVCIFAYSVASPLLHHIWFFLHGDTDKFMQGFFVMFVGDLVGTLIVVYSMKLILSLVPFQAPHNLNRSI